METKEIFESVFKQAYCKISAQIVEQQDEMIMKLVHQIGGTRYEHITLDKNKVRDALENATARELIKHVSYEDDHYVLSYQCPKCGSLKSNLLDNYCNNCGQKFVE